MAEFTATPPPEYASACTSICEPSAGAPLAIAGLVCVQVGIVCTVRLLGFTRRGEVFSPTALRWVDGIIGAFLAASAVCLATLAYQAFTVGGPPLWTLLLLLGAATGISMALLMSVMRTLLVQATMLRLEMDAVI